MTQFSEEFSDTLSKKMEELGPGSWIKIVSVLRVGRRSGTLLGIMKRVIENNVSDYVVLVVVLNKRVSRQLYRYALGAWKRLLSALKGKCWNAGVLAELIYRHESNAVEARVLWDRERDGLEVNTWAIIEGSQRAKEMLPQLEVPVERVVPSVVR